MEIILIGWDKIGGNGIRDYKYIFFNYCYVEDIVKFSLLKENKYDWILKNNCFLLKGLIVYESKRNI